MFVANHIYGPITKDHRSVAIATDSWRHVPRYTYVAMCGAESLWRVTEIHQPATTYTHVDLRGCVVAIITAIYLGVCLQAAHDETVVCKSVVNYNVRQKDGRTGIRYVTMLKLFYTIF